MTLFFSTKENTECQLHDIAIKIGKKKKNHQCVLLIKYLLNKRQSSGYHVFATLEYFKLIKMKLAGCF